MGEPQFINRDRYPETLGVKEIKEITGLGDRAVYELLGNKPPFRVIKLGNKFLVPKHVFFNWFEGREG